MTHESAPVHEFAPVPDGTPRPYWSVMLPTYNCSELFEATLRSVLDQDAGPDRMEIVVVDDCSPRPRHEEIVRRLAPGRVEIHRQPSNRGLSANWNTCIARSRGHWVHILHQDDLVLPGFYERLARAGEHPGVGAAYCRNLFIDGEGRHEGSMRLESETPGILPDWLASISQHQLVQFPAIAVRRAVYEHIGGFRDDLYYALDWEMWVRIAASYPVWYEPEPLACYRIHAANETSRLKRNNRDIGDVHKAIRITRGYLPPELRPKAGQALLAHFRGVEIGEATAAFRAGDLGQGLKNLRRAVGWDPSLRFSRTTLAYSKWALKIWGARLIGQLSGRGVGHSSNDSAKLSETR